MTRELISVIIPVYNEAGNIRECLRRLWEVLHNCDHEILICYDFDEDTTLAAIAAMKDKPPSVRLVKNDLGRGAAFAMRSGLAAARGDVIVTTMADLSDPPEIISEMARLIRSEGADVVSGSRYMKGGSQEGGPLLKRLFSRAAGLSLCWIAGLGTHDATNNFRAYSRKAIDTLRIQSTEGFELALELTVKAHLEGLKVAEVPSTWVDRSSGASRFRMWRWLPVYLRWYLRALAAPLFVWAIMALAVVGAFYFVGQYGKDIPWWDEFEYVRYVAGEKPVTLGWLWQSHKEHRIALPKVVYMTLAVTSGSDFRSGMYFNVAVMSAIAFAFIIAARRVRGRFAATDAFFPLAWLHWGHAETMLWSFQVQFTLSALLFSVAALAVFSGKRLGGLRLLIVGMCVLLLPLCGAQGLLLAAPLAVYLAIVGIACLRSGDYSDRPNGLPALVFAGAALVLGALYFVGLERSPRPAVLPSAVEVVEGVAELAAGSLGPIAGTFWPFFGVAVGALYLLAAAILVRTALRRPDERQWALGVLAVLAGVVLLAAGIVLGRSGRGTQTGLRPRYIVASLPALCCILLVLIRQGGRRTSRVILFLVFAIALGGVVENGERGLVFAKWRRRASSAFKIDADAGLSSRELARRYRAAFYGHQTEEGFAEEIEVLRRAQIGPFREDKSPGE